jgi:hypothetical protein
MRFTGPSVGRKTAWDTGATFWDTALTFWDTPLTFWDTL